MGFWLGKAHFVLAAGASHVALGRLVRRLGRWQISRIWGENIPAGDEEEWLRAADAWLKKVPLRIRQKTHCLVLPGEQLEFRWLNVPDVPKSGRAQAIAFELQRALRGSGAEDLRWVSSSVSGFLQEKEGDLACFAVRHSFLEAWLELLARRYVSVRHVWIESLLPLLLFENERCPEETLFVYAGAHVLTLGFGTGRRRKMAAIPCDHPGLLRSFRKVLAATEEAPDDRRVVEEILAADPTTAAGACGLQARQQLHARLKQAELALYRETGGEGYHRAVIGAGQPSARALLERVLTDAGKQVIPASEYFKIGGEKRIPEALRETLEPSLVTLIASAEAARSGPSACVPDLLPGHWRADYRFTRAKAWLLGGVLTAALLLFGVQNLLERDNRSSGREIGLLKNFQQEALQLEKAIAEANRQILMKRKDADRIRSLVNHQDAWLKFFNELQAQAAAAKTLWFDAWEWKPAGPSPQISLRGTLLTAEVPGSPNAGRGEEQMERFLRGLRHVSGVKDVQNVKLLLKDEAMVSFSCDLLLRKETALSL